MPGSRPLLRLAGRVASVDKPGDALASVQPQAEDEQASVKGFIVTFNDGDAPA